MVTLCRHGGRTTLTAEGVSDPDSTAAWVEFYHGAELLGIDEDGVDDWTWTVSTAGWTLGEHSFTARAQDNDGAWSNVVDTTVTVENAAPVVAALTAEPDPITRPGQLTLTAEGVSDPDGTVARVEFYHGAELLGIDEDAVDGWTWTVSTAGWSLGEHSFTARAQDDDGAWSEWAEATVQVVAASDAIGTWRNGWFSLDMDGDGEWDSSVDKSIRFGGSDHTPLIGDFSGDGVDQIGVWRNGWFSLHMAGDGVWDPAVDQSFRFGSSDHTPIIGDWNGDGVSQIGVWRNGWFSLNDNGEVRSFRFGSSNHTPLIGDWNGDGVDQIGVWRNGWFSLDDDGEVRSFRFGRSDAMPIIGDFNGDGVDHIGTWRNGWFSLDMDGDGQWDSSVDKSFRFGGSDATPLIGTWSLSDGQALHAAGLPADTASAGPALDQAALDPIVVAAIADWDALLGLSAAQFDRLQRVEFVIADLPGTMLGRTRQDTIYLDAHAAGFGWYINPTDADFEPGGRLGELTARPGTDAVHRIDLLTAVMHEMGHLLGRDHAESGVMQPVLRSGVRWLAESDEVAALAGEQALLDDGSLEPDRLDAYFATVE